MKIKIKWQWVIVTTFILFIFILVGLPLINNYSNDVLGTIKTPDTSFIYSSKDLYDMAASYGISGRSAYIKLRWTFDVAWPLLYTLVLVLWTVKLVEYVPSKNRLRYLYLLPLISMGFDFMENVGASIVMHRYPSKTILIDTLTPIMTFLKWMTVIGSLMVIIYLIFLVVKARIKDSNQRLN